MPRHRRAGLAASWARRRRCWLASAYMPNLALPSKKEEVGVKEREGGKGERKAGTFCGAKGWAGWARAKERGRPTSSGAVHGHEAGHGSDAGSGTGRKTGISRGWVTLSAEEPGGADRDDR